MTEEEYENLVAGDVLITTGGTCNSLIPYKPGQEIRVERIAKGTHSSSVFRDGTLFFNKVALIQMSGDIVNAKIFSKDYALASLEKPSRVIKPCEDRLCYL